MRLKWSGIGLENIVGTYSRRSPSHHSGSMPPLIARQEGDSEVVAETVL